MRLVSSLLLLGCAGCAARASIHTETSRPTPAASAEPPAQEPLAHADRGPTSLPERPKLSNAHAPRPSAHLSKALYAGTIDRAGLMTVLDQGLGRFLGRLRLAPVVEGKRFVGFAIAGLDPAWDDVGLVPGDVIVRVNGQVIERPEQAMAAFESLRAASEVALDLMRQGEPASLRFRIE